MTDDFPEHRIKRRRLLATGCALALGAGRLARGGETDADVDAAHAPPQAGDRLVFAYGERAGQIIKPDDIVVGAKQVIAYPADPATKLARDGTRLNELIVVRLDPQALVAETLARAAEGVVAYSGVCTHTGCDVTDWFPDSRHFKCPCHESEYDPADSARVVSGPAPWQLAALPLMIVEGTLAVAGPFEGRVGFAPPEGFGPGPGFSQ
jgi:rieske iron-sulfur protein